MPSIPPILDTPSSRMIYRDIAADDMTDLLGEGETAWQAISGAILESQQGYPDTTLVQVSTHLTPNPC